MQVDVGQRRTAASCATSDAGAQDRGTGSSPSITSTPRHEAVDLYNEQRDGLCARRKPRIRSEEGYTLRDLCNEFLTSKLNKVESGELSRHTHADYQRSCARMIDHFGCDRRVDDLRPQRPISHPAHRSASPFWFSPVGGTSGSASRATAHAASSSVVFAS
jgi:hypothetical protein